MNMSKSQLLRKHSMLHGLRPEFIEALRDGANAIEQTDKLQKAFALACRFLEDCNFIDPPLEDAEELEGHNNWQKYFLERVESEPVCRVCGCTQDNACPGGCYWVEPDLCSKCAEHSSTGE